MTGETDHHARLDRTARALHAEAVARVSPQTLARLRPRRQADSPRPSAWRARPLGWSLATACAAVFVVAVGMRGFAPPGGGEDAGPPALAETAVPQTPFELDYYDYSDPLMAFEEDPDLFLWLASAEARPLAME